MRKTYCDYCGREIIGLKHNRQLRKLCMKPGFEYVDFELCQVHARMFDTRLAKMIDEFKNETEEKQ